MRYFVFAAFFKNLRQGKQFMSEILFAYFPAETSIFELLQ